MNKKTSKISGSNLLVGSLSAVTLLGISLMQSAFAVTIPVTNGSFEASFNGGAYGSTTPGSGASQVPGWSGSTFGSVDNVSSSFTLGLSGSYAVYVNGLFTQTTSLNFVVGETYTISLDLGRPIGSTKSYGVTFGFQDTATAPSDSNPLPLLGSEGAGFTTASGAAVPLGTFQNFSASYTAVAADAGKAVTLGITDFYSADSSQYIDNVTASTTAVPEPSTYFFVMLGVAGLVIFNRQKNALAGR